VIIRKGRRSRSTAEEDGPEVDGKPIGRRTVLGLVALAGAGVVGGSAVQDALAKVLGPLELRDPTGLLSLIPVGDSFRFYSVTGAVPTENAETYRLAVDGMVTHKASYTLADLQAMPQISLVRDFQCVTGWRVPQVHWSGVRLSTLLDRAVPTAGATAIRFRSFDGTYTESLTLEQAMLDDVIVALQMLGGPVTHDHGGPVRMYVAPMYGYKSTKWLSGIELTPTVELGYWEPRGYPVDGFIDPSLDAGA
jgi:DMSO/TMAO reductase YedYZ molybdopterin-dependent catalytic subunit